MIVITSICPAIKGCEGEIYFSFMPFFMPVTILKMIMKVGTQSSVSALYIMNLTAKDIPSKHERIIFKRNSKS